MKAMTVVEIPAAIRLPADDGGLTTVRTSPGGTGIAHRVSSFGSRDMAVNKVTDTTTSKKKIIWSYQFAAVVRLKRSSTLRDNFAVQGGFQSWS